VTIEGLALLRSGKVRDVYEVDAGHVLLVATDRISTFDVVHPTEVPDKGRVLTGLSAFWFGRLGAITDHHLVSTSLADLPASVRAAASDLRGRVMLCRRVDIVPFECVVRGYLAGSAWQEYRERGSVCGIELPVGLQEAARLPSPIFTPATKAEPGGHDLNVRFEDLVAAVGAALADRLREVSTALYAAGAAHAADRGLILADTKFEFGQRDGRLVLADEVLTPDSSRYWLAEGWRPGASPPSFDKQPVRDFAAASGWDKRPPAPMLPDAVVAATRERYVEAYERLTGTPFADWLALA
jgi:phosphoribosylaminoimidazole-succinocarboxamide synthase